MKIVDITNAVLYKTVIACTKVRVWLQFKLKLTKAYQPSIFNERDQSKSSRECQNRFDDISNSLPDLPFEDASA